MNYFLLAETDFFRLINEAGDCNMETAYMEKPLYFDPFGQTEFTPLAII